MKCFENFAATKFMVFALLAIVLRQSAAEEPKQPPTSPASPTAAPTDQPETVHFILHPAESPYAALRYRLANSGLEKTPGNAAPNYMRAALVWFDSPEVQAVDAQATPNASSKLDDWLAMPLDELAKNESAQAFFNSRPTGHWDMLALAARREQCDWDLPLREFNYATLIPELKKMRDLGRLVAFKARVEISRGQFDKAIDTLNTGLAMARHAAQAPTLVNALVGIKLAHLMLDQAELLIQQPHCPNLYWSLTALPDPLIDIGLGMGFERDFLYLYMPELRDIRTAVHTEAEWDQLLLQVANKFTKAMSDVVNQPVTSAESLGVGAYFAITAYPKAKAELQRAGYTPFQIKDMPVSQAILTAEVELYEHESDNIHKWFFVDGPSALQGLANAEQELKDLGQSKQEIIPFASLLLPALSKVKSVQIELDRQVAALRCVEALRLYAAQHNGQLPKQWSDIKEAPVPNDPSTGKPFIYSGGGEAASLSSLAPLGRPASEGFRWEIQLAPGKK
jgi:hypothetical protein